MSTEEKASVSLSSILNTGVRKHGKSIVSNLTVAIKLSRLYDAGNQNVKEAVAELLELLQGFIRLQGNVNLTRIDDFLFLNDIRIQIDLGGYENYRFVVELMEERDIGDISFASGLTESEIEKMVAVFNEKPAPNVGRWDGFTAILQRHTLSCIDFSEHEERHDIYEDFSRDVRRKAIHTFFKSIATMRKAYEAAAKGRRINLKSLKVATQAMVDLTLDSEHILMALTNIKDHGELGVNHPVNVAVLSVAIGAKLGLSKKILGDLGITALLHDIGKATLPERLRTAGWNDVDSSERDEYLAHVYGGTEVLLTQSMVHQIVKSMNVSFLHHYRYDRTGYPQLLTTKVQNLFTRIVAIADYYDHATTAKNGRPSQLPDEILRVLMDRGGTEFDPLVVKAFVNLMGLYPVGCVVRLDGGEVATVIAPPSNPSFLDRPSVRLVSDADGQPSTKRLNLLDKNPNGSFKSSILKLYQQEEVSLELDEYLAVI